MRRIPHQRRSIRLKGYDYSTPGEYFVTICTYRRRCILIDPGVADRVETVLRSASDVFPNVALDTHVVMPNHIHMVVRLLAREEDVGATLAVAPETTSLRTPPCGTWMRRTPLSVRVTPAATIKPSGRNRSNRKSAVMCAAPHGCRREHEHAIPQPR